MTENTDVAGLVKRIKNLEQELRVARRETAPNDGMVLVPADEYNRLCDQAEECEDVLDELKGLRAASIVKFKHFDDDAPVIYKKAPARGHHSGNIVLYHGKIIVLPHTPNYLFRTYEVLHLMKLQGQTEGYAVYLESNKIASLLNDSEKERSRPTQPFDRWKQHLGDLDISWHYKRTEQKQYFGIRNFDAVYHKVFDLLTIVNLYNSFTWKNIKKKARSMGLSGICLCVDSDSHKDETQQFTG